MLRGLLRIGLCMGALLLGGCAYYMDAIPPSHKNLALLQPGTPRERLLLEYGFPVHMEIRDGVRKEIYRFYHGDPGPSGTRQIVASEATKMTDGLANVATLGVWYQSGMSQGTHLDGVEVMAEVTFDREDSVVSVVPLKGPQAFVGGDLAADEAPMSRRGIAQK